MSTTTRQTVPPVTCQPWCVHGDGHASETFTADQWCETAATEILASHYPSVEQSCGTYRPETVVIYGMQPPESERGGVPVSLGDADTLRLTADEARALAGALLATVEAMEAGDR